MKLVVYFLLLLNLICSLEARLLTPLEMKIFINDRQGDVNLVAKKYKVHPNYAAIEVAKQEMLKKSVEDISYYKRVILSAFQGIGSKSGLSKTKKANPFERRIGYLALYAIGVNLDKLTDDSLVPNLTMATLEQIKHISKVNGVIRLAFQLRSDLKKLRSNGSSNAAREIAGLVEETRVSLSKQSSQPKPSKAYPVAAFMKDGELDKKYRLLDLKLSFDETVDKLLAGKKLFDTPAADVLKAFKAMSDTQDYKGFKKIISDGVRLPMDVWDEFGKKVTVGKMVTERDLIDAKGEILALMSHKENLQCLLDNSLVKSSRRYWRLKPKVRTHTRRLMLIIHVDKLDDSFEYDEDVVKVGNELNEVLGNCEGIGVRSKDWRSLESIEIDG